jgi:hypothetical protein
MSLEKRRLPWQQPIQGKERERYVNSYKELIATISSFTSGPRSTGQSSQFTIKIAKPFAIRKPIYLTSKSSGLIIDGMGTLLTVDESFVDGSYVFDVDAGSSSEFPNVLFKNIHFNAYPNEKKVTFIKAATPVDIIDGYFNCWQLVKMGSISSIFTIIGNTHNVYDPTSDAVCNIIEGTGIVHCERNEFTSLSAGHCSIAGRLVGSFVMFNRFNSVSNEINLSLSTQNMIAFNRGVVAPTVGSNDVLLFNHSLGFGSFVAGQILKANGAGAQPTFQP